MSKQTEITPRKGRDKRTKPRHKLAASLRLQEAERLKSMADSQKAWRELRMREDVKKQLLYDTLTHNPFKP